MNIGLVGIGFMGWIHYLAYKNVKGVKLTAVCTRDPQRLAGDWRGIQGNFGPPGEQVMWLAVQALWAVAIIALCRYVQRRGERKVVVQGG